MRENRNSLGYLPKMKGQMENSMNMIAWVVCLAVFVIIMMVLAGFMFEFDTIPTEPVETRTACDMAYRISRWDAITTSPGIFDKAVLERWNEDETADIIFEELTETFFIPDTDYYLEIDTGGGEEPYSLFVPPESKSVFKTCAYPTLVYSGDERLEDTGTPLRVGDTFQKAGGGEVKKDYTRFNGIYMDCERPVFYSDDAGDEMGMATMKAAFTTNLATKLRDGIYRVGVQGEESAFYALGPYPEGCIINEGAVETEENLATEILQKTGRIGRLAALISGGIPLLFADIFGDRAGEWYSHHRVRATCGFGWGLEIEDNYRTTLTVNRGKYLPSIDEQSCPIQTRIPKSIVEEAGLKEKLCTPKKAVTNIWIPNDELSNYQYFLKVESLRDRWSESRAEDFCASRCSDSAPRWFGSQHTEACECYCGKLEEEGLGYCSTPVSGNGCTIHNLIFDRAICSFARSQYLLYENMPEDAMNFRYIVVETAALESRTFSELAEGDYYASASACAGWPESSGCDTSEQCEIGNDCIGAVDDSGKNGICSNCQLNLDGTIIEDQWGVCSPAYLAYAPTLGEGVFACQKVHNQKWPSNTYLAECLPVIPVTVSKHIGDGEDEPIGPDDEGKIELSCPENENLELNWTINASGLCCPDPQIITDEDGNEIRVCTTPPPYCLKMKFWPNLDSGNVRELIPRQYFLDAGSGEKESVITEDDYVFTITRQVCRGTEPYNNAPVAFVTAEYVVDDPENEGAKAELRYGLSGSEIFLN
ncbi:MAG: hypothetical protein ACP5E4_02915 [Candidatus Aenigmatarchaeota archaeon]